MADDQDVDDVSEDDDTGSRWDALEVLRGRAAEAQAEQDRSLADLRSVMSDEEIFEQFGIDLSRIE